MHTVLNVYMSLSTALSFYLRHVYTTKGTKNRYMAVCSTDTNSHYTQSFYNV